MAHELPLFFPSTGTVVTAQRFHLSASESRVTIRIGDASYMPGCLVNRLVQAIAYKVVDGGVELLYGGKNAKRAAMIAQKENGAVCTVQQLNSAPTGH